MLKAIRIEAPDFDDIFVIIERCLDVTAGRDGRERPSSLILLEWTGHQATQSPSVNNPCNIKGWNTCFNDLIGWVGKFDREALDADHEDELVLRLCFLLRDGGEEQLKTLREWLLRNAHTGTTFSKRLGRAISILDSEAKFDEIVRIAETLTLDMPPGQKDRLVHELLLLMKDGGDKVTKGETKETPLHRSARRGEAEQISVLLRAGANINAMMSKGRTALQLAADLGFQPVTTILLMNGADINGQDGNGDTALHITARNGYDMVMLALLERGADINGRNGKGDTALHLAACNGYENLMPVLLERGADINARDAKGNTALHLAAFHRHMKVIQILLERGADINAQNSIGDTARELAEKEGNQMIIDLLDQWPLLGLNPK